MRSVNLNLMPPPSDDAYGHKAKFPNPSPRMRKKFQASSGRLAFSLNSAWKVAVLDPVNAHGDLQSSSDIQP